MLVNTIVFKSQLIVLPWFHIWSINHLKCPIFSIYSSKYFNSFSSSWSNSPYLSLSMSRTPTNTPFAKIGITISDLLAELQAIWPSNLFTSSRIIDSYLSHADPQTPTPLNNFVQAGGPWNCPNVRCSLPGIFLSQ